MSPNPTARRWITVAAATLILAACGGSDDDAATPVAEAAATADESDTADQGDATAATTSAPGGATTAPQISGADKPDVQIPDEIPTELVVTELIAGSGPEAAQGDTVVVNYVGVRSSDGVEFDNSYDRGSPFPVVLGSGGVIAGWEQGLIGVKAGGQRQLDIPADLAYGDNGSGAIIRPGDAISFVIDVMSITPAGQ